MLDGLRWKLVALCTVTTGLIATVMAVVILLLAENLVMKRAEAAFADVFRSVQYALEAQNTVSARWLSQTEFTHNIQIHVEQNGVPLRYMEERHSGYVAQAAKSLDQDPDKQEIQRFRDVESGNLYFIGTSELQRGSSIVRFYAMKSLEQVQAELVRLRISVCLVGFTVLCLLWLFSWRFVSRLLRPVEENRQRQVAFIASASHELRTPLAVIRTGISAIRKAPPEQADHFLGLITREEKQMSRLVDELLLLASADNRSLTMPLDLQECEIESLLIAVYERFEQTAQNKDVRFHLNLPERSLPKCSIDFDRMEQALSVLVDNAICYTPEGGEVWLSASAGRREIAISVRDNGAGISSEHRPYIFDRFYRADTSRTGKAHFGLGLSIAKEIAELHHGRITYREPLSGGSEFLLFLPSI